MRVVVIRHHEEDDAGFIAEAFAALGAEIGVHMFPADGPLPALDGIDHVIMLGAVWSVYDETPDKAAMTAEELDWLRRADELGVPVLGICFGAQLLAAAFGGGVEPAGGKEIGWITVDSADHELIPPGPWLVFHGDRCVLPGHATLLASNPVAPQAFSVGRHLAIQFHPEVDRVQLTRWLEAGGRDEMKRAGCDAEQILAQTIAEEPAARRRAATLVESARRIAVAAGVSPPRPTG